MQERIKKLLEVAVNAPSGDNSQPWIFHFASDTVLEIFNIPTADETLYNFDQRGSIISHGALLENICLLAKQEGLNIAVKMFPGGNQINLVCTVEFSTGTKELNTLAQQIPFRHTNRKPYKKTSLSENFYVDVLNLISDLGIDAKFIKDPEKIQALSKNLCFNERLMLENYYIHKELFSFIRWNKNEEEATKDGLFVDTLELKPQQLMAFRLFRHWPIMKILNYLKISKVVAKDTQKNYAATGAFGLLSLNTTQKENFFKVGRALQRIWLFATKNNIELQPTAALIYLNQRLIEQGNKYFSSAQYEWIRYSNIEIKKIFSSKKEIPAMLFRLGYGEKPTAFSVKKSPKFI